MRERLARAKELARIGWARASAWVRQAAHWALDNPLRGWPLLLAGVASSWFVYQQNPVKGWLIVYALSKVSLFSYAGYWIDRVAFRHSRPHLLKGIERGAAEKRRAILIAAAIIAGGWLS